MINRLPRIGVIILTWNGLADTMQCLGSLVRDRVLTVVLDLIVVDNGSAIDATREIRAKFPDVACIRLDKNVGYAKGCNIGATHALRNDADFLVFLNNDTLVSAGVFDTLTEVFRSDASIGVASPLIFEMTEAGLIDFAGARTNLALGRFDHVRQLLPEQIQPFETDYVCGCCMMLSRAVIDRIGLFDEKLFAYFEDVDLSFRARRAGFKLVCVPTAVMWHAVSASTRRTLEEGTTSPLKHYLLARNRLIIIDRYAPPAAKWCCKMFIIPVRTCFYIAGFLVRRRWCKLRWMLRGVNDGWRGNLEMPTNLETIR
jgi:GT2 family glycosyltransferase